MIWVKNGDPYGGENLQPCCFQFRGKGWEISNFFKKNTQTETMETLRRFSAFPVRYIKCKVATAMGEGIRVLSSPRLCSSLFRLLFSLFYPMALCISYALFAWLKGN